MNPWEQRLTGLFLGVIESSLPPSHENNESKTQYEYWVNVSIDRNAGMPVRCVLMDRFGGWFDEYEDRILTHGTSVFVMMPRGNHNTGIIIGMPRFSSVPQTEPTLSPDADFPRTTKLPGSSSRRYEKYFLNFTETYEKNTTFGEWTLKHDMGPFVKITSHGVTVTDGVNTVTMTSGLSVPPQPPSLKIDAAETSITIAKALNITVIGDVKLNAVNVNVKAKDVKIECVNVDVKCKSAKITANSVDIKALSGIALNKILGGMVITTMTQPTCYVSGIPFKGVSTVKAG